MLRTHLINKA